MGTLDVGTLGTEFWVILVVIVILSATQDVAIDAYTIQSTTTRELGVANSVRITLYRVAMLTAGGLLVWLAGRIGWFESFTAGAVLLGALAVCALLLPPVEQTAGTRNQSLGAAASVIRPPGHRDGHCVRADLQARHRCAGADDAALLGGPRAHAGRDRRGGDLGTPGGDGRWARPRAGCSPPGMESSRGLWVLGLVQALSGLMYWGSAARGLG